MAIAFVKDFYAEGSFVSVVNLTVPAGGIAAGNLLVVFVLKDSSPSVISTIVDAGSNSYAQVNAVTSPTTDRRSFVWYGVATTGLAAASTIAVTCSDSNGFGCIASEFSGCSATPLDKFAGQQFSGGSPTSGLTAATTQADELVFGAYAAFNTLVLTSDGSFTQNESQATFGVWRMVTHYKIVASIATYESNGTVTATDSNNHVATFKADGGAPAEKQSFYAFRRRSVTR